MVACRAVTHEAGSFARRPALLALLLVLAGALVRAALLVAGEVDGPVGGDLEHWAYAALQLRLGRVIAHPPLLPAIAALADRLLDTGLLWPLWLSSLLPGLLLAPAAAWASKRLDGPASAPWAGLFVLLLPATTAISLAVDPAALAMLLSLLLLGGAPRLARDGSARAALLIGLLGGLGLVAKEGGALDLLLVALPALLLAPRRRLRLALLVLLPPLALALAFRAFSPDLAAGKAALPFLHARDWWREGRVPELLFHAGNQGVHLLREQEGDYLPLSPGARLLAILRLQAVRLIGLAGPLCLLLPLALLHLLHHRRRYPPDLPALLLPRAALLALALVIVVQGRHVEWLALPVVLLLASMAARLPRPQAALLVLPLLLGFASALPAEAERLRVLERQARVERGVARWTEELLADEDRLTANLPLVGAILGRPVLDDLVHGEAEPPEGWLLVRQARLNDGHSADAPGHLWPLRLEAALRTEQGVFGLYRVRTPASVEPVPTSRLDADGRIEDEAEGPPRRRPQSRRKRGGAVR